MDAFTLAFMYASLRAVGLQYGPSFQVASRVNVHPDGTRVLGCLSCANSTDESGTCVSPAVLDGCMQLSVGLQEKQSSKGPSSDAKVPAGFSVYCNASRLSSKTTFGIAERGEVESSELGNATISSHYILDIHGSVVSKLHELQAKSIKQSLKRMPVAGKTLSNVKNTYAMTWQSSTVKPSTGSTEGVSESNLFSAHLSKATVWVDGAASRRQGHVNDVSAFLSLAQALCSNRGTGLLLKTFGSVFEAKQEPGCKTAWAG